ncbi:hypothetical protein MASR2M17_08740 [Aminivibrio sp.]
MNTESQEKNALPGTHLNPGQVSERKLIARLSENPAEEIGKIAPFYKIEEFESSPIFSPTYARKKSYGSSTTTVESLKWPSLLAEQ